MIVFICIGDIFIIGEKLKRIEMIGQGKDFLWKIKALIYFFFVYRYILMVIGRYQWKCWYIYRKRYCGFLVREKAMDVLFIFVTVQRNVGKVFFDQNYF